MVTVAVEYGLIGDNDSLLLPFASILLLFLLVVGDNGSEIESTLRFG